MQRGGTMDNSINNHFDFFLYEVEAETIETEAEQLKAFLAGSCRFLNGEQKSNIDRSTTPLFNKLHQAAARARTEANQRKANIENIEDPELKEMVTLFYVKRLTLEQISYKLYCDRTTISRKIKRYCEQYL